MGFLVLLLEVMSRCDTSEVDHTLSTAESNEEYQRVCNHGAFDHHVRRPALQRRCVPTQLSISSSFSAGGCSLAGIFAPTKQLLVC
jgi:hypothetical protein